MNEPCPFCTGKGRITRDLDPELYPKGLSCDACSGTGDLDTMRLIRAYRLGRAHERSVIAGQITGARVESPELGFTTIAAAVVSDSTRQRYEEAIS